MTLDIERTAEAEIAWWDKYNRRNWKELEEAVRELRKEQFGVEISDESASYFVKATEAYIGYKQSLSDDDEDEAQRYLVLAIGHMKKHYTSIESKLEIKNKNFLEELRKLGNEDILEKFRELGTRTNKNVNYLEELKGIGERGP